MVAPFEATGFVSTGNNPLTFNDKIGCRNNFARAINNRLIWIMVFWAFENFTTTKAKVNASIFIIIGSDLGIESTMNVHPLIKNGFHFSSARFGEQANHNYMVSDATNDGMAAIRRYQPERCWCWFRIL